MVVEVRQTEAFKDWLARLRDLRARAKIAARIDRLSLGHKGDVKAVGEGVSELRVDFGPGYRIYFVQRGLSLVILLCGGDKGSQERDIRAAKKMAAGLED